MHSIGLWALQSVFFSECFSQNKFQSFSESDKPTEEKGKLYVYFQFTTVIGLKIFQPNVCHVTGESILFAN